MIYQSKENLYSHFTAKERKTPSLPTRILFQKKLLKGKTLDFGCGLGKDIEFLKNRNLDIVGYDPYYYPKKPTGKFDVVICNYVLNILLPEEQTEVLMAISELLKFEGKAYFTVRRDIKRNKFVYNPKYKVKTYQCNVKLPYKSIFKNENCEIYEYQHYTHLHKGKRSISPFLADKNERELITESATAFAIFDKFPLTQGHSLIIPKSLINNYFELTFHEQIGCWIVLNRIKYILSKRFKPEGFNIGVNINKVSGQTISQVHIHLIPRYKGDIKKPVGGIRNMFPGKGNYLKL